MVLIFKLQLSFCSTRWHCWMLDIPTTGITVNIENNSINELHFLEGHLQFTVSDYCTSCTEVLIWCSHLARSMCRFIGLYEYSVSNGQQQRSTLFGNQHLFLPRNHLSHLDIRVIFYCTIIYCNTCLRHQHGCIQPVISIWRSLKRC